MSGQKRISWCLMPVVDCLELTAQAIEDCLAQEGVGEPRVLVIDNGSSPETRRGLEAIQAASKHRVLVVFHTQPLGGPPHGTLNSSWNRGLEALWGMGAERVLVVNNDIRLAPATYELLNDAMTISKGLFVTAVGVREGQFSMEIPTVDFAQRGGPDFSCFLISRSCHRDFPFDEKLTYFGDNDYHRQLILAGQGERIFGVNIPYLHYASQTIAKASAERQKMFAQIFEEHRARYVAKWGGLPGEEQTDKPYGHVLGAKRMFEEEAVRGFTHRPPLRPEPEA